MNHKTIGKKWQTEAANAWFADGIFFVPLQPVSTTSGVIAAIAEGVGFRFYSDTPPQQQLVNFLHTKQMLLVLDNLEHLPEGALLVAELLSKAPHVKILATSQKALNLYEEWFHPLTGMTLPHTTDRQLYPDLASAGEPSSAAADAVQLFVQSARRARSDFTLAAENEAVVRICRLVDGMPLAIELAAAWLKVLPCPKIADELERSLDLLTTRHQNIPVRHRSMHAVLEQAWQLLDEEQRDVLKRLAVFRGGCTQDAAQVIANADVLTLVTLVENALLWITPSGRYQMHNSCGSLRKNNWPLIHKLNTRRARNTAPIIYVFSRPEQRRSLAQTSGLRLMKSTKKSKKFASVGSGLRSNRLTQR